MRELGTLVRPTRASSGRLRRRLCPITLCAKRCTDLTEVDLFKPWSFNDGDYGMPTNEDLIKEMRAIRRLLESTRPDTSRHLGANSDFSDLRRADFDRSSLKDRFTGRLGNFGTPDEMPVPEFGWRYDPISGEYEIVSIISPLRPRDMVSIGARTDPTATNRERDLADLNSPQAAEQREKERERQEQQQKQNAERLEEANRASSEREREARERAEEARKEAKEKREKAAEVEAKLQSSQATPEDERQYFRLVRAADSADALARNLQREADLHRDSREHRSYIASKVDQTLASRGRELRITDAYRDKKPTDSFEPHERGALDFSSKDLSSEARHEEARVLSDNLGSSYRVIVEELDDDGRQINTYYIRGARVRSDPPKLAIIQATHTHVEPLRGDFEAGLLRSMPIERR
jgi:hypothetical protein